MGFLEVFIIGIGLAMDAFAVSLTEGLSLKKLNLKHILRVALTFGAFQAFMPFIGWLAGGVISSKMTAYGNYVAFIMLTLVGGKMILEARKEQEEEDEGAAEHEGSSSNIIVLGIATSIDALAIGFTFSLSQNFNILPAVITIGLVTFVISATGVYFGNKFGQLLGSKAEYLGGIILVSMGIKALF